MKKNNTYNIEESMLKFNKDPNFVPFRINPKIFRVSKSRSSSKKILNNFS